MQEESKEKKLQSSQYNIPYHYIPQIMDDFNNYKSYISWNFSFQYIFAMKKIYESMKNNETKKFLDIGCGDGRLINFLSQKFSNVFFTGIDYDSNSIKWANLLNKNKNINFISGKLEDHDQNDYDTICVVETLEHINPNELNFFCKEIEKKLAKGGNLYITVPHINKKLIDKHFQHFDFNSITNLFSKDLKIVEQLGFPKQNIIFNLINKIFYNRFWFWEINFINQLKLKYYKLISEENNIDRIFLHFTKI